MWPTINYDPDSTAAYVVDKSTARVIYAIAAAQPLPLLHLYITSAFTTEEYRHDHPVYVKQMPRFNYTLTHQDSPIARLRLNLYGTKPDCHLYHTGLDNHLKCHGFGASEADLCFTYVTAPAEPLSQPLPLTIFSSLHHGNTHSMN